MPDEAPRLDALDGWPPPEAQTAWLGDASAEAALREAYASGRIHHAWLIGGPKGIGKATLAFRFARFVLDNPHPEALGEGRGLAVPADHPAFRRVAAQAHPDLLVLERPWDDKNKRFRTELAVDEIRRTIPFFGATAGEGGWRVAIVDCADDMNASAANALLKILEEPPARSLFLIVAHAPGKLLPTIRSRCRRLILAPLPDTAIETALAGSATAADADEADIKLAVQLSGGSLRRAIQLLAGEGLDLQRTLAALLADLPDLDSGALHGFADRVSRRGADDEYDAFLEFLRDWLDRRVRRLPEANGAEPAARLAAPSLARWAEVWEKINESATNAQMLNLDRKQVVLSAFFALARVARM
ncbi:MAG: DNA polymerase III subunit delta' [Bauldia sp.]